MKFLLSGKLTVRVSLEIEAADEFEAEERSQEILAETFVGHGSLSGLVGLSDGSKAVQGTEFITDDCYPEWDDIREVPE